MKEVKSYLEGLGVAKHVRSCFDVGANRGQTAVRLRRRFPEATVHAFEPVRSTFRMLQKRVAGDNFVIAHRMGLGKEDTRTRMRAMKGSPNNTVLKRGEDTAAKATEVVQIRSGISVCEEFDVSYIDLLKIDTEGYELEVLKGFQPALKRKTITVIDIEVGMTSLNRKHTPFRRVHRFLEQLDYHPGLIHEIVLEKEYAKMGLIRRANIVFVNSDRLAALRARPHTAAALIGGAT